MKTYLAKKTDVETAQQTADDAKDDAAEAIEIAEGIDFEMDANGILKIGGTA